MIAPAIQPQVPCRIAVDDENDYRQGAMNRLLMSRWFWESLKADRVLVFETDTALCPESSPFNITHFLQWEYIGAPFPGPWLYNEVQLRLSLRPQSHGIAQPHPGAPSAVKKVPSSQFKVSPFLLCLWHHRHLPRTGGQGLTHTPSCGTATSCWSVLNGHP